MKRLLPTLLLAACATTPAPGSREATYLAQAEQFEARNAQLRVEIAAQQAKVRATFADVTRAEAARGSALACAIVQPAGAAPMASATPARFEVATKKHRVTATYGAPAVKGREQVATGTCRVVSP